MLAVVHDVLLLEKKSQDFYFSGFIFVFNVYVELYIHFLLCTSSAFLFSFVRGREKKNVKKNIFVIYCYNAKGEVHVKPTRYLDLGVDTEEGEQSVHVY